MPNDEALARGEVFTGSLAFTKNSRETLSASFALYNTY